MASTIKIDTVTTPDGTGNITFSRPIVADIAVGSTLPAIDGSALTNIVHTPADNSVTGAKLNISLVAGDTMYASGTDTLAKLAKGTAAQVLTMNTGATAPEWAAAAGGGDSRNFIIDGDFTDSSWVLGNTTGATSGTYLSTLWEAQFSGSGG